MIWLQRTAVLAAVLLAFALPCQAADNGPAKFTPPPDTVQAPDLSTPLGAAYWAAHTQLEQAQSAVYTAKAALAPALAELSQSQQMLDSAQAAYVAAQANTATAERNLAAGRGSAAIVAQVHNAEYSMWYAQENARQAYAGVKALVYSLNSGVAEAQIILDRAAAAAAQVDAQVAAAQAAAAQGTQTAGNGP
jgi:hypothetical protein